jgi:hypothetical protein
MKQYGLLLVLTGLFTANVVAQPSVGNAKITVTSFLVFEKAGKLSVEWSTDGKQATNYWEVQARTEQSEFSTIALVLGPDPNMAGDHYSFSEKIKTGVEPKKYYRLRHIDQDGNEQITAAIMILPAK